MEKTKKIVKQNGYAVFINNKKFKDVSNYKTSNRLYKKALELCDENDSVELYKVIDLNGNSVSELKKSTVLNKVINKKKTSDFKKTLNSNLLELFDTVTPSDVVFLENGKKLSEIKDSEMVKNKNYKIKFSTTAKDFLGIVPMSENYFNNEDINIDYEIGTSIKKPYKIILNNIEDLNGFKISYEIVEKLIDKIKSGIELEDKEYSFYEKYKAANKLFKNENKNSLFTIVCDFKFIDNKDFGKTKEEETFKNEDYDDEIIEENVDITELDLDNLNFDY